jgi:hypothetical protein
LLLEGFVLPSRSSGERQVRLVPRVVNPDRARLRRLAAQLHEVYKKYKVGLIKESDLTDDQKRLLKKYYGV